MTPRPACGGRGGGRGGPRCGPGRGGGRRGGLLEPAILAALGAEETHGYDLVSRIDELTDGNVCADPGGVYRTLRRLEDDGFVVSDWEEGEAGPQRRRYALTDVGREVLAAWVDELRARAAAFGSVADAAESAVEQA